MGTLSIIGATPNPVREGTSSSVTVQVRYTPDPVDDGLGLQNFTYRTVEGTATKDDFVGFADSKVTYTTTDSLPGLTRLEDFFFTIPINDDAIVENQESFVFELATVNGAVADQNQRIVIDILDNDSPDQPTPLGRGTIRFEFANYVVIEGQPFVEARVIREGGQSGVIQGGIAVEPGTAVAGDFTPPTQTSIFFGDQDITPKIVRIPIIDDIAPEIATESFTLALTELRSGTDQDVAGANNLVVDRSVVQIRDNDGANNLFPSYSLTQRIINVPENAGFVEVEVDVLFPPGVPAVGADTEDARFLLEVVGNEGEDLGGLATEDDDFFAPDELEFTFGAAANQSFRRVVRIPIVNDNVAEGTEQFSVRFDETEGGFVLNDATIINIIDDDAGATIGISDDRVFEGSQLQILVSPVGIFSPGEVRTIEVRLQDVTALQGSDFTAPAFATLTFSEENPSPQIVTVEINADLLPETDETFQVIATGTQSINGVTNPLTITNGTATVTIEEATSIRVTSITPIVTEGVERFAQVRVERTGDTSRDISADLATQDGSAIDGDDYVGLETQTIRFAPGDTAPRIFNIPIIDNDDTQQPRTLTVNLSNPVDSTTPPLVPNPQIVNLPPGTDIGGLDELPPPFVPDPNFTPRIPSLSSPATITINDNDGPNSAVGTPAARGTVQFELGGYTVSEDRSFLDVRVVRVGGTNGAVNAEITVGTQGTGTGIATDGTDFVGPAQTSIFFADGSAVAQTIRIPIINDTTLEPTETFSLNIAETRGDQTLVVNSTVVQIVDDDSALGLDAFGRVGFGNLSVINVNEGAGSVTVPITFGGAANPGATVTVNYSTVTGTGVGAATAGADFLAVTTGTLSFPAGTTSIELPVTVPLVDDRTIETQESFAISLDSITGAAFAGSQRVVVNIIDNDGQGDGSNPTADTLESPFFSPITPTTPRAPFETPEAVNPPAIPTDGSDSLIGTNEGEALFGQQGNDTLDGRDGRDTLFGGEDQDVLIGGAQVDELYGNAGEDQLNGGSGDDLLFGGKGNDTLFGGIGNDFIAGDAGNDILIGDAGQDRFAVQAIEGVDFVGDFVVGNDLLALTGGLQLNQLAIVQSGLNTIIRFTGNNQDLLVLGNVTASDIQASSFVIG